jgi:hypothetical protein
MDDLLHPIRAGVPPPSDPNGSSAIPSRKRLQSGAMKGLLAIPERFGSHLQSWSSRRCRTESILRCSRGSALQQRPDPGIIASAFVEDRRRIVEQQNPSLRFSTTAHMQSNVIGRNLHVDNSDQERRFGPISSTKIEKMRDASERSYREVNSRSSIRD